MVNPGLKLSALFAVPILQTRLDSCERLNRELELLFLQRESDEYRNPTPSHTPQPETFESRFSLFRWPDACVQELRRFMLDSVLKAALQTSTITPDALSRLKFSN